MIFRTRFLEIESFDFFYILTRVYIGIVDGFKGGYDPKVDKLIFDIQNRENLTAPHPLNTSPSRGDYRPQTGRIDFTRVSLAGVYCVAAAHWSLIVRARDEPNGWIISSALVFDLQSERTITVL